MPTSDMFIYIGPSVSGKSLILRHALRAAFEIDAELKGTTEGILENYRISKSVWSARYRKAIGALETARITNGRGLEALEISAEQIRQAKPKQPRVPRWIITDATKAGWLGTLPQWPSASLVSDEGTKLLEDLLGDPGFVNSLLGGELIERETGRGTQRILDPRSNIVLATHPLAFEKLLEKHQESTIDNGFLARACLFAPFMPMAHNQTGELKNVQPELPRICAFNERLRENLLRNIEEKRSGSFQRRLLRLSQGAESAWVAFAQELKMSTGWGGCLAHVPTAAARAAEKTLRRAARDHDFSGGDGDLIAEETVLNAIVVERALLADWCALAGPPPEEPIELVCARALHEKLHRHLSSGGMIEFAASWLQPRAPKWVKKQHYEMALAGLAARGLLVQEERYLSQKPSRWIRLNAPAILSVFPGTLR